MSDITENNATLPPRSRLVRRPYFLITTPDGAGHYLREQKPAINSVNQSLFSRREELTEFLAPAQVIRVQGEGAAGRRHYEVHYELSDEMQADIVPLETIADSLTDDFAKAASAFLGREGGRQFAPHEKALREGFRVPDPDLEPDCYWLYGKPGNRRLLILWGCETVEGSSIPLLPDPRKPGKNLLDWFRQHPLGWRGKQQEMLRLLLGGSHPLQRYVAMPVMDHKGGVKAYAVDGKEYAVKELKRTRHVAAKQIQAFEGTARGFYAEADPKSGRISAAERELRAALKFPDPEIHPVLSLRKERRFVVAMPSGLKEEECLHLCDDEGLHLPPPAKSRDGASISGPTFVEKLRPVPVALYATLISVAALLVLAGLVILFLVSDRRPPRLQSIIAENDAERIVLVFDENIAAGSLLSSMEGEDLQFSVRDISGKLHGIKDARPDNKDMSRVILTLEPELKDAGEYEIIFSGVADTSFRRNVTEEVQRKSFSWFDRRPPQLDQVSAEGSDAHKLLLFFDKPLEAASATRSVNYSITGFRIQDAAFYQENTSVVVLTAQRDTRAASGVEETGFLHKGAYQIEVSGLRDDTSSRNPIEDAIVQDFIFMDQVPPRLMEVDASENQLQVRVHFSEPLDTVSAESPLHYTIVAEGNQEISVSAAELSADGKSVLLSTEPLQNNVSYAIRVQGIRDRSPELNEMVEAVEKDFHYRGRPDVSAPMVDEVRVSEDRLEVVVLFNEAVKLDTAEKPANYAISGSGVEIVSARRLGTDNRRFLLRVSEPLPQGARPGLVVSGVSDRVGNISERQEFPFQIPGVMFFDATLQAGKAEVVSPTRIRLQFNDRITQNSAVRLENYRLPEPYILEKVAYDVSTLSAELEISPEHPLSPGGFQIEVHNIRLFATPDEPQAPVRFSFNITR